MKKWYIILCVCFVAPVVGLFGWSIADRDEKLSGTEELAQFPKFSLESLLTGELTADFEEYFSDQFPLRDTFMAGAKYLNSFYTLNFGRDEIQLDVDTEHDWEHGAAVSPEMDDDVIQTVAATTTAETTTETATESSAEETAESVTSEQTSSETSAFVETTTETDPPETTTTWVTSWTELESPWGEETEEESQNATNASGIIIIGNRAMERVYGAESNLDYYAETVNGLYAAVGEDVRVFAMLVPKAIEFWSTPEYRSGSSSQLDAINYAYSNLTAGIICVDAYSELFAHRDEAIYFRTDHHWSQRGAYYGFRAFCNSANLTPYELSDYSYEVVPGFLGTLYSYTKNYAASNALKEAPDDVEIFRPVTVSTMEVFSGRSLSDGSVKNLISSYDYANESLGASMKYFVFMGGDRPICHIENPAVTNGRKLLILKESYGNAFTPFLGDVFEEVWAIDPRSFNGSDEPSFTDLVTFVSEQGITDILVLNNLHSAVPGYMWGVRALMGMAG